MLCFLNKEDWKKSGIYKISCRSDLHVYIGSTKNFRDRFNAHKLDLKKGIHRCKKLQEAYVLYGQSDFQFEILEITDHIPSTLTEREQYYMDSFDHLWNTCPKAHSPSEVKHADEFRFNISHSKTNATSSYIGVFFNKLRKRWTSQIRIDGIKKHLGYFDTEKEAHEMYMFVLKNPNTIIKRQERRTAKGEAHGKVKLTETDVLKIKTLLSQGYEQKEVATMFNMNRSSISAINTGRSWKHLI
jgi:group I intron endonuclease